LIAQLEAPEVAPTLLAGRAPGVAADRGPIVCVCFDIGMRTIVKAIAEQQLTDVAAVGKALNAGTNCGSCRPAIANLIASARELANAS
jgi:assimilatory nitrate reductase catalytic subunit